MAQHFLLSAKARSLSLAQIARMSDDEAYAAFRAVRFAETEGSPTCPRCACAAVYEFRARRIFKCKACEHQFSLTSGTIFASRKLKVGDILYAIALFVDGVSGHAALRMGRDLNVSYKTAFVLLHKLREVMGSLRTDELLRGEVEIDGVWVGGHVKKLNLKAAQEARSAENRRMYRLKQKERKEGSMEAIYDTDAIKRRSVVTMKERRRGGRSHSFVFQSENLSLSAVRELIDPNATVITDGGAHWIQLDGFFNTKSVNHSVGFMIDGVHINGVESYHSRIRRGERGVYHRISWHLQGYANEFAWREDHRRVSNGRQFQLVLGGAANHPISRRWKGYWQHRKADGAQPSA